MGIFSFIRSIFDTKYNCEYFIKSTELSFRKHKKAFPGYDNHFYLAQAWLAYMSIRGANPNDADLQVPAFTTTYLVACVPSHLCARALGLFLLYRERPEDFKKYKVFEKEFNRIMLPVFEAQENGTIEKLYKKYNPNMADEMSPAGLIEEPQAINQPPQVVGRCPQCPGNVVLKTIGTLQYLKCTRCNQVFSNRTS